MTSVLGVFGWHRRALPYGATVALAAFLLGSPARAQERAPLQHQLLQDEPGAYTHWLGSLSIGDGLRFNNPYRLRHELGKTGESVSSTAAYSELALGATFGNPLGLSHGARLSWSLGLAGVPQQIWTPAYMAILHSSAPFTFYGWAGLPTIVTPDFNIGGELGLGAIWFFAGGLGATLGVIGDGFYGAGTTERSSTFYPILSGQLGIAVSYEALP